VSLSAGGGGGASPPSSGGASSSPDSGEGDWRSFIPAAYRNSIPSDHSNSESSQNNPNKNKDEENKNKEEKEREEDSSEEEDVVDYTESEEGHEAEKFRLIKREVETARRDLKKRGGHTVHETDRSHVSTDTYEPPSSSSASSISPSSAYAADNVKEITSLSATPTITSEALAATSNVARPPAVAESNSELMSRMLRAALLLISLCILTIVLAVLVILYGYRTFIKRRGYQKIKDDVEMNGDYLIV